MRSLSPCDTRYSPGAGGVTTFSSAANAGAAVSSAAVNAVVNNAVVIATVFIRSSILIGRRGRRRLHGRDRMRHGPSLQRLGAHRVRRVARGADVNLDGQVEVVLPE